VNTTLTRGALVLAAILTAACGGSDSTAAPVAGTLQVTLTSPNTDDGAVMFQVTGDVDSVTAPAGLTLYQSAPSANVIRAIVTGNIASGGTLLTLHVPNVGKASSYGAQVLQVSAAGTYAQRLVGGYTIQVHK
jgi:hypothetical protein